MNKFLLTIVLTIATLCATTNTYATVDVDSAKLAKHLEELAKKK